MTTTASTQPTAPVVVADPSKPIQPLFSVSPLLPESRQVSLKPVYMSLGLDEPSFRPEVGGQTDPSADRYAARKSVLDTALRGSRQFADRIWLFKGDSYFRYFEQPNGNDTADGPLTIASNWSGWPPAFGSGVTAALLGTGPYDGKAYFFMGGQYIRYDIASDQIDATPKPVAGSWPGVPDDFAGSIDAAIHGVGQYYGIAWLFSGGNYLRYNMSTDQTEAIKPIVGNWGGWPAEWADGVDFAFYGTGGDSQNIYFFRGDKFLVYNLMKDSVDVPPALIVSRWRTMSRFMPRTQLFISEKYELNIFRGEMGAGDPIPGSNQSVAGNATTEFWVVTKQSQTITSRMSTNILESNTQQASDSFSNAVRDEQSQSTSTEDYAYSLDASFKGEAHATLTGGAASANLSVKGGSQDTRNSFAGSVGRQTQARADETRQAHQEQVRTASSETQIDTQTETGFKQVIDNSKNPNPLNFTLFQLTQEHIVVLSLVDAALTFFNGDPRQTQTASIQDMGALLSRCLVSQQDSALISGAVVNALQNVVDVDGNTRSLLVPTAGGDEQQTYQVDHSITSTFVPKDSAGNVLRNILVPGIIVHVERPVALTANTALAPIHVS